VLYTHTHTSLEQKRYNLYLNRKCPHSLFYKGVHFEINFWYVLSYLKGIQDVGVFVSILIILGQTVLVCQSYNGGLWSPPKRTCT